MPVRSEPSGMLFRACQLMCSHIGLGIKDQDRNIVANQKLLNGFFDAAEPLLTTAAKDEIPANKSSSGMVTRSCFSYLTAMSKSVVKMASKEGSAGSVIGRKETFKCRNVRKLLSSIKV